MTNEREAHTGPHWCDHDGLEALLSPPSKLYYIGKRNSTPTLETRDCPVIVRLDADDSAGTP